MALSHGISQRGLGDELFERVCRLIVAPPVAAYKDTSSQAISIEALRVVFNVKKKTGNKPNTAEFTVYNLAESSRALMQSKGARVILQAGYATTSGTIFFGDSLRIEHRHDGSSWTTKIEAQDSGRAHQHARVRESFAAGARAGDAYARVAAAMGLGVVPSVVSELNATKRFEHGWAAHGRAAPELTRLLKAMGYEWSAQDGDLVVSRIGSAQSDLVQLDEDHGLIGTPEHVTGTKKGKPPQLRVRSLLRHELRPGGRIQLVSRTHNGTYKLMSVEHEGDTDGGPWYSTCDAEAIG